MAKKTKAQKDHELLIKCSKEPHVVGLMTEIDKLQDFTNDPKRNMNNCFVGGNLVVDNVICYTKKLERKVKRLEKKKGSK